MSDIHIMLNGSYTLHLEVEFLCWVSVWATALHVSSDWLYSLLANEVWGKVMYLHLSVIGIHRGDVYLNIKFRHAPWADTPPRKTAPKANTPQVDISQADTLLGRSPPLDTTGYSQQAGGRHPTGMYSCFAVCLQMLIFGGKFSHLSQQISWQWSHNSITTNLQVSCCLRLNRSPETTRCNVRRHF